MRWSGVRCVPRIQARVCPAGWRFSNYYNKCVRRVGTCPSGRKWNGYRCVAWRHCRPGYYWSVGRRMCKPKVKACPHGYRYRAGWGCQRVCASGWYFSGGRCLKTARACPQSKFWSNALRRCVKRCRPGLYWSYRFRRCKPLTW